MLTRSSRGRSPRWGCLGCSPGRGPKSLGAGLPSQPNSPLHSPARSPSDSPCAPPDSTPLPAPARPIPPSASGTQRLPSALPVGFALRQPASPQHPPASKAATTRPLLLSTRPVSTFSSSSPWRPADLERCSRIVAACQPLLQPSRQGARPQPHASKLQARAPDRSLPP